MGCVASRGTDLSNVESAAWRVEPARRPSRATEDRARAQAANGTVGRPKRGLEDRFSGLASPDPKRAGPASVSLAAEALPAGERRPRDLLRVHAVCGRCRAMKHVRRSPAVSESVLSRHAIASAVLVLIRTSLTALVTRWIIASVMPAHRGRRTSLPLISSVTGRLPWVRP